MELSEEKIALKSKLFFHFFKPVAEELDKIRYAIIKGEPLSYMAYGQYSKRYFNDIDLLVDKKDLLYVKEILEKNNFFPVSNNRFFQIYSMTMAHQVIPYVKRIGNFSVYIDVNFDIFWGEYEGKRFSISEFLNDTMLLNVYGCKIKVLKPLKALFQLMLHNYKDMNSIFILSIKNMHYKMFQDILYLLINNTCSISINRLYELSIHYEVIPYIYYVLYYTAKICNDSILQLYRDKFYCKEGEELLDYYGLNRKERHKWKVDFETRINSNNLYKLMEEDLYDIDLKKIQINKQIFLID